MSSDPWSTHAIELGPERVIKRFKEEERERGEREWRALSLLAVHAPGLAPAPLRSELSAPEPMLEMSRLNGLPLRGHRLREEQIVALAEAVKELHEAVPSDVLKMLPVRPGHHRELITQIGSWFPQARPHVGPLVGKAMDTGMDWLASSDLESVGNPDVPWVFGPGDGNLANYLWNGTKVKVVDFEDSGRSDRAFELAEITEHVSSWVEHPLDVSAFLGNFSLTRGECARLLECRRLLALVWLFLVAFDDKDNPRNPRGSAERQADRLLKLLA